MIENLRSPHDEEIGAALGTDAESVCATRKQLVDLFRKKLEGDVLADYDDDQLYHIIMLVEASREEEGLSA